MGKDFIFSIAVNVRYLSSYSGLVVSGDGMREKEARHQQQQARGKKNEKRKLNQTL